MILHHQKKFEADNRTGVNHGRPDANSPVCRLTATSIMADHVEDSHGEVIGYIEDLMINPESGRVEYAIVKQPKLFGIGGKRIVVKFIDLDIDEVRKVFILSTKK